LVYSSKESHVGDELAIHCLSAVVDQKRFWERKVVLKAKKENAKLK
jgi:hypothetical protein